MVSKKKNKKLRIKRIRDQSKGRVKVDDGFRIGPIEVLRAGRYVQIRNIATPEEREEIQKKTAEENKKILEQLDEEVRRLQSLIEKQNPLSLMHRGAYVALGVLIYGKTESEMESDEAIVLPTLEYLQYLISRTGFDDSKDDITEEDWDEIWGQALQILKLTSGYLQTRPPIRENDKNLSSIIQMIDGMRFAVRVNRFSVFLEDYWRLSLKPYSKLIPEYYGITIDQLIEGLKNIRSYQMYGVGKRYEAMMIAQHKFSEILRENGISEEPRDGHLDIPDELMKDEGFKDAYDTLGVKSAEALTEKILDVTVLSELPSRVLDVLSVVPGEEKVKGLTGPNHEDLSPLSSSGLHFRPFLKIGNRYYMTFHSGLEDRVAELIEQDLSSRISDEQRTVLEKKKSDLSEQESLRLLNEILDSDCVYQSLYYKDADNEDRLTELDGLIISGDNVFLVEVKSGRVSEAGQRGAPLAISSDLKDLIVEAHRQSARAEKYLTSGPVAIFYDETGKNEVISVPTSSIRNIFRVIITKEQLGWIGANLSKLSGIDESLKGSMPWHVSLDDLMAVVDLFKGRPLQFQHYLEVRKKAAEVDNLEQKDEIEHIALYHAQNMYYLTAIEHSDSTFMFNSAYQQGIDKYFMDKAQGLRPVTPTQKLTPIYEDLLHQLSNTDLQFKEELTSLLLSYDFNARKMISTNILKILQARGNDRRKSLRLGMKDHNIMITVSDVDDEGLETEKKRNALFLANQSMEHCLLLRIKKGSPLKIIDILKIKSGEYSEVYLKEAQSTLERDIQKNSSLNRIKPNQQCPCGSGERFKNCHGKRR